LRWTGQAGISKFKVPLRLLCRKEYNVQTVSIRMEHRDLHGYLTTVSEGIYNTRSRRNHTRQKKGPEWIPEAAFCVFEIHGNANCIDG